MRVSCCLALAVLSLSPSIARSQNYDNPNIPYDPDAHTVVLYHLDEGSGVVAHDESSHGLDGAISGATWTPAGRFGAALSLDGDGDFLELPDSELYTSDDLTLEAWVFLNAVGAGDVVLIDGWFNALNGGGRRLGIDGNGRAYAVARIDLGPISAVEGTTQLPPHQWVHLAAVFDGTNASLRIVVNGNVEAEGPLVAGTNAFHRLTIGRDLVSPYGYLTGMIDEVRVSDTVRLLLPVPVADTTWGAIKAAWRE